MSLNKNRFTSNSQLQSGAYRMDSSELRGEFDKHGNVRLLMLRDTQELGARSALQPLGPVHGRIRVFQKLFDGCSVSGYTLTPILSPKAIS